MSNTRSSSKRGPDQERTEGKGPCPPCVGPGFQVPGLPSTEKVWNCVPCYANGRLSPENFSQQDPVRPRCPWTADGRARKKAGTARSI